MRKGIKVIPTEYIALLLELNAHDVAFFDRNIRGHLEGVYRVLESWSVNDDLAVAGLFHAIYLTEFFVSNEPDEINRSRIRAVIGSNAEEIVYSYCVMDRIEFIAQDHDKRFVDGYSGSLITLSKDKDRKLVELIWANSIEQLIAAGERLEDHENLAVLFESSRHRVGPNAIADYELLR